SRGLDVISSNVANVNTPGYKGTELLFQDIFYGYDPKGERNGDVYGAWIGHGVAAEITSLSFSQGDFRDTDNATDVAIDGQGFFIVSRDGEYLYTRDGQFEFDDNSMLVTRAGRDPVMGLSENGTLSQITLEQLQAQPAKPTTEIRFINNLSLGGTQHVLNNVKVINSLGETI